MERIGQDGHPLTHLGQLLGDVSSNKHSLQVDPEVLHDQPALNDLSRVGQLLNPELNLLLERSIVPAEGEETT